MKNAFQFLNAIQSYKTESEMKANTFLKDKGIYLEMLDEDLGKIKRK